MTATATDEVAPQPARQRTPREEKSPAPPVLNIQTILVTPEQANRWLANNADDNRHQRETKIDSYARDMKAGKWQITGDTIKIAGDAATGLLIDGQHRLRAVVKAGIPVYMVVAFDVPHAAMGVIDTGIARTFADNLRGAPIAYRNQVAAVVRRVAVWDRGNRMGKGGKDSPTHPELLAVFNTDVDGFVGATARGMDVSSARISAAAPAGTAFYLFARISAEHAHEFFDMLVTGANLPARHPVLTVRDRLMRSRRPGGGREDRLDAAEQLALLVRAWNAFREGRTLDKIATAPGQLNQRSFPTPV